MAVASDGATGTLAPVAFLGIYFVILMNAIQCRIIKHIITINYHLLRPVDLVEGTHDDKLAMYVNMYVSMYVWGVCVASCLMHT